MADALLILRTPLQAHLAQQVLTREDINDHDLIYMTQQDSEEDRLYFAKLASGAGLCRYVYVRPARFDVFNHLKFRQALGDCFKDFGRDLVLAGSVDAPVVSALMRLQEGSDLVTVDDGSGNINQRSLYHDTRRSWRYRFYARMLGADDIDCVRGRIARHYTLFSGIDNIVEEARLRYLPAICPEVESKATAGARTYFVGQPVARQHRAKMTEWIRHAAGDRKIDYYVRHPREEMPLALDAPLLDKKGRIAEEAIMCDAAGRDVHIIAGFSTVALNLAPFVRSATVVIQPGMPPETGNEIARIAALAGCIVHRIDDPPKKNRSGGHDNNQRGAGGPPADTAGQNTSGP